MSPSNAPRFVAWSFQDFEDATDEWPVEAVGIYVRLLNRQARTGSIPADPERLAALVQIAPASFAHHWRSCIREKFEPLEDNPQRLANPRMEREREKAVRRVELAREHGKRGGRPRKEPNPKPNPKPNPQAPVLSSSSSSSPLERETDEHPLGVPGPDPARDADRSRSALDQASLSKGAADWMLEGCRDWIAARQEEVLAAPGEPLGLPLTASRWAAAFDLLARAGREAAQDALTRARASGWRSWPEAALRAAGERDRALARGAEDPTTRQDRSDRELAEFLAGVERDRAKLAPPPSEESR